MAILAMVHDRHLGMDESWERAAFPGRSILVKFKRGGRRGQHVTRAPAKKLVEPGNVLIVQIIAEIVPVIIEQARRIPAQHMRALRRNDLKIAQTRDTSVAKEGLKR